MKYVNVYSEAGPNNQNIQNYDYVSVITSTFVPWTIVTHGNSGTLELQCETTIWHFEVIDPEVNPGTI